MFFFSLIFSVGYLLWLWKISASPNGAARTARASCVAVGLGLIILSVAFVCQAFVTLVISTFCYLAGVSSRSVFRAAVAAGVVVYCGFLVATIPARQRLERLREAYPVTSLASRLAYERDGRSVAGAMLDVTPVALPKELESALSDQERQDRADSLEYRNNQLRYLHTSTADSFVYAAGFGPTRMAAIHPARIALPEPEPAIPQPGSQQPRQPYPADHDWSPSPEPTIFDLRQMNRRSRADFAAAERWGYVKSRDHTIGFASHGFRVTPKLDRQNRHAADWQTVRIELVSLLRQAEPRVYVSKNLPAMDELRNAPTRAADEFELTAVEKLRTEEDVVTRSTTNVIYMLGAIRASDACRQCHHVRRGDLLGAFSYELHRLRPLPDPQPRPTGVPLTDARTFR